MYVSSETGQLRWRTCAQEQWVERSARQVPALKPRSARTHHALLPSGESRRRRRSRTNSWYSSSSTVCRSFTARWKLRWMTESGQRPAQGGGHCISQGNFGVACDGAEEGGELRPCEGPSAVGVTSRQRAVAVVSVQPHEVAPSELKEERVLPIKGDRTLSEPTRKSQTGPEP